MNVALPAIRRDLHGGLAIQEWVVDAYLLTLGAFLLIGGSLGDLFGRRRMFALGVAGFGLASLACALAPDGGFLIGARAAQGVSGAMLVPATLALLIDTFSESQRSAAIGSWTAWTGIATVAGPLVGGALIELGDWRWVFVVNLPLILITLALLRQIPSDRPQVHAQVDWLGGGLAVLGLGAPIFALIQQPSRGWGDPQVWLGLLIGVFATTLFVLWEARAPEPMLPLGLFRIRNFRVGNAATLAFYGALNGTTFVLVVFLQQVEGYGPITAGLALLPLPVLTFVLAKRFGALADRLGPRLFMGIGPLLAGTGLLLLTGIGAQVNYLTDVLPGLVLFGLGVAVTVAPLTAAVLGAAGPAHSGVASAVNTSAARIAGLVAVAAIGAALAAQFSSRVHADLTRTRAPASYRLAVDRAAGRPFELSASAFPPATRAQVNRALVSASVDGLQLSLEIAAVLALAAGLISLGGIRNPGREVSAESCPGGAIVGASADLAEYQPQPVAGEAGG